MQLIKEYNGWKNLFLVDKKIRVSPTLTRFIEMSLNWKLVETLIPDYEEKRKWLRKNKHLLNILKLGGNKAPVYLEVDISSF